MGSVYSRKRRRICGSSTSSTAEWCARAPEPTNIVTARRMLRTREGDVEAASRSIRTSGASRSTKRPKDLLNDY